MHTLRSTSENGDYDVWFISGDFRFAIAKDINKHDAMKLVNYLNGGTGNYFNEPVHVKGDILGEEIG